MYLCQAFHTPGDVPISDATLSTPRTISAATNVLPPPNTPNLHPPPPTHTLTIQSRGWRGGVGERALRPIPVDTRCEPGECPLGAWRTCLCSPPAERHVRE